jgi:hypothetical protein
VNHSSSQGVASRGDPLVEHARELEERKTEEQAERWAQALTTHVAAQWPLPVMPDAWRASDSAVTLAGAQTPAPAGNPAGPSSSAAASSGNAVGSSGNASNDDGRVILHVKTADLGELSLVLDRTQAGVRVVIGVENSVALGEMLPEREALSRQLASSGVNVESIQIVRQSAVGTVLAPQRNVARAALSATPEEPREEEQKARRRGSRKLNLVG